MSVVLALLVPEAGPAGSRADRAKALTVGVPVPAAIRAAITGRAARRLTSARVCVPPPVVQIPLRTYRAPGSSRPPNQKLAQVTAGSEYSQKIMLPFALAPALH